MKVMVRALPVDGIVARMTVTPGTTATRLLHDACMVMSIRQPKRQYLFFGGFLLRHDSVRTLSQCGVSDGDTLTLCEKLPPDAMQLFVKTLTGKTVTINAYSEKWTIEQVKHSICLLTGTPVAKQRLVFGGRQLEDDRTLKDYKVVNESTLHLVMRLLGMISVFKTPPRGSGDAAAYLMATDTARAGGMGVPTSALKRAMRVCGATTPSFSYMPDCKVLAPRHYDQLCQFLDYMWALRVQGLCAAAAAKSEDISADAGAGAGAAAAAAESAGAPAPPAAAAPVFHDIKLVLAPHVLLRLLSPLDVVAGNHRQFKAKAAVAALLGLYRGKPANAKIACRMTRGPCACIDFHCDGVYAHSTTQIVLNDRSEYVGGDLVFVGEDCAAPGKPVIMHTPARVRGAMTWHPRTTLHGVTRLESGTRKSLFVLDQENGLGDVNVVVVPMLAVDAFLCARDAPAAASTPPPPKNVSGSSGGGSSGGGGGGDGSMRKRACSSTNSDQGDRYDQCIACWDAVRTHAVVPCGHQCLCGPCAGKLQEAGAPVCPLCRAKATLIMKVY